jgi:hypothetical protein
MQNTPRRRRVVVTVAAIIATIATFATACAPPSSPGGSTTTTTAPAGIDPELAALLEDPEFVAQFGETPEEQERILAEVRATLEQESSWGVDPSAVEQSSADKDAADKAAEQAAIEEQEREEAAAADERKRLDALQSGPELEELAEQQGDGAETFDYSFDADHWRTVEGGAEMFEAMDSGYKDTMARVIATEDRLRREGLLEEVDQIPGYVPPEGEGDSQFAAIWEERVRERGPATGACKDRDSSVKAPNPASLRPGTIYTPYQNTFAAPSGSPTHLGQLRTTMIGGQRHFIVEGHLGDLDVSGVLPGLDIQTMVRARITVHTPDNIVSNYDGLGEFIQIATPGQPVQSGQIQVLCYQEDLGLPTSAPIRRALFRAYIPFNPEGVQLVEPGFQVKATVSNHAVNPGWFFGADMRTVYLGKPPLAYNSTFTGGGFGVSAGRGVVIDDNGVTGDDLESSIRGPVSTAITNGLSGLDGTSDWVLGKKGGSWGWFGFHINNSNPTTPTVDIDWNQTTYAGAPDDEFRLKGTLSMNNWLIEGYTSVPFAALGLIPCYWRMKVNWSASIYASVNINDTARTILQPNIQLGPLGLNVHSMFVSPLPLGCNFLYTALFADRWVTKVNGLLPTINSAMANQLQSQPSIPNAVPATVPIGGGNNMQVLFAGWNDTCVPYGCNGVGAGDMAMSWAGLEATGDFRFTDTKPALVARRFPASYSPTTLDTANGRVRKHFEAQNEITDFGAWINPTVLNQALRVMAEHGRLDLGSSPSTPTAAKSPPIYLSTPIAADKPLGLFLPHLEIDDQPNGNIYALDAIAAVGVTFDNGTRKLVPAPVSPADPGFGIAAWTLKCSSTIWATCYNIPAFVSTAANYVANTLLNPLLENSIGQVTIPNTGGFNLTNLKILNEDGHLGIRTSVGAPQLRAWGGINSSTYDFDTYWEGLPGSGPVTYSWSIKDDISGNVIFTTTSTQHQLSGFPTSALQSVNVFGTNFRSVTATITASRGGTSRTASHTNTLLL